MRRLDIIKLLQSHQAELREMGVEHLYLFGSAARDAADDDSDVDLFFDHVKGALGLFEVMDVKERATDILGCKADIMTRDSLHPAMRRQIEQSAVLVF
jgi:predicted nucleotidyltransferase